MNTYHIVIIEKLLERNALFSVYNILRIQAMPC
jgi:hypothetical protein